MSAGVIVPGAHIVIVGGSLAGVRAAASLRELGFGGHLSVVDQSPYPPYDRPPLSKGMLTGAQSEADIRLSELVDTDVVWQGGRSACGLSMDSRTLHLDDGGRLNFDGLIIATGVSPRRFGASSTEPGPLLLRSLDHARDLRRALTERSGRLLVIGAGFIGTEVAASARGLGWEVTLVVRESAPLQRALGRGLGRYVGSLHRRHGVDLRLDTAITDLHVAADHTGQATLDDGSTIEADLIVAGIGSVPNTAWLDDSDLWIDDGVHTESCLRVLNTSGRPVHGIAAAGDITRWSHPLFGPVPVRVEHWSNAAEQGRVAARTVLADLAGPASGIEATAHASVPSFWSDQYDTKILSVGLPHLADTARIVEGDPDTGTFVVAYGRDGLLVGAAGVGSSRSLARYRRAIARREDFPDHQTTSAATARTA